jgi:hypothetical protein
MGIALEFIDKTLKRIQGMYLVFCNAIPPHGFLQDDVVVAIFDQLIHK